MIALRRSVFKNSKSADVLSNPSSGKLLAGRPKPFIIHSRGLSDMRHHLHQFIHTLKLHGTLVAVAVFLLYNHTDAPAAPSHLSGDASPSKGFTVLNTYPHDDRAFTQGLVFHNGYLYESTGLYGKSSLRKVNWRTGAVEKIHHLPDHLFGEGATILNNKIYQLTWKVGIGIIYALDSFAIIGSFAYPFEGWGITHDGQNLILSNGTNTLFFYRPDPPEQIRKITVSDNGAPVNFLNELEYIEGKIYANIWRSDKIISIDPGSGKVIDRYNLADLRNRLQAERPIDVLNGIAFDRQGGRIFVTGKLWPKLFEVKLQ